MLKLKNIIDENNRFKNFSEEVIILFETRSGEKYSLYNVKNKNNVIFQAVSGQAGIKGRGFMGFVNGDRARPTVWGFTAETKNNESEDIFPSANNGDVLNIDFNGNPIKTVDWDITLDINSEGNTDSKTVSKSVTVVVL